MIVMTRTLSRNYLMLLQDAFPLDWPLSSWGFSFDIVNKVERGVAIINQAKLLYPPSLIFEPIGRLGSGIRVVHRIQYLVLILRSCMVNTKVKAKLVREVLSTYIVMTVFAGYNIVVVRRAAI